MLATESPASPGPVVAAPPPQAEPAPAAAAPPSVVPPSFNAAYLRNPPPAYPALSRRRGEKGTVVLRVHVSRQGAAEEVQARTSSGSAALDEAALEAVRQWRFVPARQGGEPVAVGARSDRLQAGELNMESAPAYGIASFFAQTDAVARCALLVLVGMSVATSVLILVKSIHAFVERRHIARFLQEFWARPSLDEATSNLDARPLVDPFSSLALACDTRRDATTPSTARTGSTRRAAPTNS